MDLWVQCDPEWTSGPFVTGVSATVMEFLLIRMNLEHLLSNKLVTGDRCVNSAAIELVLHSCSRLAQLIILIGSKTNYSLCDCFLSWRSVFNSDVRLGINEQTPQARRHQCSGMVRFSELRFTGVTGWTDTPT